MRLIEPLKLRYRLVRRLGGRSPCSVSLVQDTLLGLVCVLKTCPMDAPGAVGLRAEAELLADLQHPRLVRALDAFVGVPEVQGGLPLVGLATVWVDGEPFTKLGQELGLNERLELFGSLLSGVSYLHRRGVLHLDLKPDNVLATRERGVVILDLGSARPLDSGPGEAGGTLGYAAPEVLSGQAASVASDVYSLGTLLYELLAGRRPHAEEDPRALREACLMGAALPLRAVAPDVPRPLAALVMDMLEVAPQRRPRSIEELIQRMEAIGIPTLPGPIGAPPFLDREHAQRALLDALSEAPAPVVVAGRPRSGRTRLARRSLSALALGGVRVLNLSEASRSALALHRLLQRDLPSLPTPGSLGWRVGASLDSVAPSPPRGVIFLGRQEQLSAEDRGVIEALLPLAGRLGWSAVMVAESWSSGLRSVLLPPMSDEMLTEIGRFARCDGASLGRAVRHADGLPGQLLRELAGARVDLSNLADELRGCWEALCSLPPGVPPQAQQALEQVLGSSLSVLVRNGLVRVDRRGLLQLDGQVRRVDVDPRIAPAMLALLESGVLLDPLWAASLAVGLGSLDRARALFPLAVQAAGPRRAELAELAEVLIGTGDREACLVLARLRLSEADYDGVLEVLRRADPDGQDDELVCLHLRALRMAGRLADAERLARTLLGSRQLAGAQLELAHCLVQRGAYDDAQEAVSAAIQLQPSLAQGEGLVVRLILAARRAAMGATVPELDGLLSEVLEQGASGRISALSVMSAARVMSSGGQLERAERLLEQAVSCADQEGDLRLAAAARLNRGNLLLRLERGREARKVYAESLSLARAIRQQALVLRLCYSLAWLELRSGRLPDAQARIAEFQEVSQGNPDPEVAQRGRLLLARLHLLKAEPEAARAQLEEMDTQGMAEEQLAERAVLLAQVRMELGRPQEALEVLELNPRPSTEALRRDRALLSGRALMALGRARLTEARAMAPAEPDPMQRMEIGELLLTWAGEDLDPASFGERRRALNQAAHLLTGAGASRAATLRDRLLDGPGAALEGVVQLTEAMHDPEAFPAALARLVAQALGAHRVLILLRIPGLGRQMTYQDLAGEEAAGIGEEVLKRIQGPDDVWESADAFADPALREASATVRTFEIKSLLAVAIPYENRAIGALYLDDLHRANRFGPEDVRVLRRLAVAAGRMIALLPTGGRRLHTMEPKEVQGVWISDPEQRSRLEDTLDLLHGKRQTNLLVTGETGVGKTWFARRVAQQVLGLDDVEELAVRRMDPQMLVSMLSGTRRGEFTGAITQSGAIQRAIAHRRALFLDEVQSLDEAGQQILLPLLELPLRRFGGLMSTTHPVEGALHIILGTNEDVSGQRWTRHFRSDLWFRMSEVHVHLPTLAQRGPEVVYRYLASMLQDEGVSAPEQVFELRALARVTNHRWPGNLRELHSFASRAAHLSRNLEHPLGVAELRRLGLDSADVQEQERCELSQVERDAVIQALQRSGWVQADAARLLGVSKWKILRLIRKYDLNEAIRQQRGELEEPI